MPVGDPTKTRRPPLATAYSVSGPAGAVEGVASGPFAVTFNGRGDVGVTPASDKAGAFAPAAVTGGEGGPRYFTFTPAAAGTHTLTFTNDAALTYDPPALTLDVLAAASAVARANPLSTPLDADGRPTAPAAPDPGWPTEYGPESPAGDGDDCTTAFDRSGGARFGFALSRFRPAWVSLGALAGRTRFVFDTFAGTGSAVLYSSATDCAAKAAYLDVGAAAGGGVFRPGAEYATTLTLPAGNYWLLLTGSSADPWQGALGFDAAVPSGAACATAIPVALRRRERLDLGPGQTAWFRSAAALPAGRYCWRVGLDEDSQGADGLYAGGSLAVSAGACGGLTALASADVGVGTGLGLAKFVVPDGNFVYLELTTLAAPRFKGSLFLYRLAAGGAGNDCSDAEASPVSNNQWADVALAPNQTKWYYLGALGAGAVLVDKETYAGVFSVSPVGGTCVDQHAYDGVVPAGDYRVLVISDIAQGAYGRFRVRGVPA